jgi:hypothetical protein
MHGVYYLILIQCQSILFYLWYKNVILTEEVRQVEKINNDEYKSIVQCCMWRLGDCGNLCGGSTTWHTELSHN